MPETSPEGFVLPPQVEAWLSPLSDEQACGPDLAYDADSLELAQAVAGKPESQFAPAEPPDWSRARDLAESLFARTRDLRVALAWGRAKLNLDGFAALPEVLALLHGLLDRFWDQLHPISDADDREHLARLSVMGSLDKLNSLLGDVRNSRLSSDARLDGLRLRDVEVALERLPARTEEAPRTRGQVAAMLASNADVAEALRTQVKASLHLLKLTQALMAQHFSLDMGVDLSSLRGMLANLMSVMPARVDGGADGVDVTAANGAAPSRAGGGVLSIDTRQEAVRAIEMVCTYLERHEPTNPAQLLLRRAARVIDKNFLLLVRELAPDAVKDVARIMGVDPATINDQN